MFGGFVLNRKEGKYLDPIIMMALTSLAIYVSATTGVSIAKATGVFLLLVVTYVSIRKTSKLIPEGIRHTWMSGIVFLVVADALGAPLVIPYAVVGLILVAVDLVRHRVQGRTMSQHSHSCEMVSR